MIDDVNALRPRMMSVAYRMLGSLADAEDAVQDAFVRAAGASTSARGCPSRWKPAGGSPPWPTP